MLSPEQENALAAYQPTVQLRVRPVRPYRGVHLFVDGDGLRSDEVAALFDTMRFVSSQSTKVIVRSPATALHTPADVVAPYGISSYLLVQKQAQLLRSGTTVVLKDVAYFCSDAQHAFYVQHVAPRTEFPDAAVYVCSPSRVTRCQQQRK